MPKHDAQALYLSVGDGDFYITFLYIKIILI